MLDDGAHPDDLTAEERAGIQRLQAALQESPWAALGVRPGATKEQLREAYFSLTKRLHPDKFYGRELGVYKKILDQVNADLKQAYDTALQKAGDEVNATALVSPKTTPQDVVRLEAHRKKILEERKKKQEAAVVTPKTPAPKHPGVELQVSEVDKQKARDYFLQAEQHYARQNKAAAISCLKLALAHNPLHEYQQTLEEVESS